LLAQLAAEHGPFDFDPCPFPKPEAFDGLTCEWGECSYVNPPFGSILHQGPDDKKPKKKGPTAWVRKAITEAEKGKRVVLVYPVDKWLLMLLAAGAKVSNLGDVRWHATEDGSVGKGAGRHIACFVLDDDEKRWNAMHHPFTSPKEEDLAKLESDPGKVRARAYDIVLNGTELGGGSIRIHKTSMQSLMFKTLGINEQAAREKFGFLLEALDFGAPPHGGLALGLDRMVAIFLGEESIREVIAFPKTQKGQDLMSGSPSEATQKQLKEIYIKTDVPPPPPLADGKKAAVAPETPKK
jgi:hypothetical protein